MYSLSTLSVTGGYNEKSSTLLRETELACVENTPSNLRVSFGRKRFQHQAKIRPIVYCQEIWDIFSHKRMSFRRLSDTKHLKKQT
jgi:hypothetical protein